MTDSTASTTPAFTSFGELLRHLRRRARITQRDLGIAVGYSEAHIARLESDQRRPDVAAVTSRFLEALDLADIPELAARLVALAQERHKPGPAAPAAPPEMLSECTPTNLREQLNNFVGREEELGEVERLLGITRLLTLTGMGGLGKSRLAAQAVARLIQQYAGGVWIVSFAAVSDPAEVATTVAATINLASMGNLVDGLTAYLRQRHALLVLDNCEHMVGACARLAVTLLQGCANLTIIVTSRERLSVPGELAWSIPPMSCEETQELFVARARAMRPDFEPGPADEPLLGEVCNRLEGNPLSIELAAARMQVLTLQEVVGLLDDPFQLLAGGSRLAAQRHRSLRAALEWSARLLTPAETALARRLAAIGDDFDLATAARGAALGEVLDTLTQLVRKSIVQMDEHASPASYRMFEMMRRYFLEDINRMSS